MLTAVGGYLHRQFKPAPDAKSVQRAAQEWFLITGSPVPTILPISRSVRPSQTRTEI